MQHFVFDGVGGPLVPLDTPRDGNLVTDTVWRGVWTWAFERVPESSMSPACEGYVCRSVGFRDATGTLVMRAGSVALPEDHPPPSFDVTSALEVVDIRVPPMEPAMPPQFFDVNGINQSFLGETTRFPVPGGFLPMATLVALAKESRVEVDETFKARVAMAHPRRKSLAHTFADIATYPARRMGYRRDYAYRPGGKRELEDQWSMPLHSPFPLHRTLGDCEDKSALTLAMAFHMDLSRFDLGGYEPCLAVVVLGGSAPGYHALSVLCDRAWLDAHWNDATNRDAARLPVLPLESVGVENPKTHKILSLNPLSPRIPQIYTFLVSIVRANGTRHLRAANGKLGAPWGETGVAFEALPQSDALLKASLPLRAYLPGMRAIRAADWEREMGGRVGTEGKGDPPVANGASNAAAVAIDIGGVDDVDDAAIAALLAEADAIVSAPAAAPAPSEEDGKEAAAREEARAAAETRRSRMREVMSLGETALVRHTQVRREWKGLPEGAAFRDWRAAFVENDKKYNLEVEKLRNNDTSTADLNQLFTWEFPPPPEKEEMAYELEQQTAIRKEGIRLARRIIDTYKDDLDGPNADTATQIISFVQADLDVLTKGVEPFNGLETLRKLAVAAGKHRTARTIARKKAKEEADAAAAAAAAAEAAAAAAAAEAERLRREAEEETRKQEAERLRREAVEEAKKQEAERLQREAEAERLRLEAEAKQREEERLRREADDAERLRKEEEAKREQQEEAERQRLAAEAKQREEDERAQKQREADEAKQQAIAADRLKLEEEEFKTGVAERMQLYSQYIPTHRAGLPDVHVVPMLIVPINGKDIFAANARSVLGDLGNFANLHLERRPGPTVIVFQSPTRGLEQVGMERTLASLRRVGESTRIALLVVDNHGGVTNIPRPKWLTNDDQLFSLQVRSKIIRPNLVDYSRAVRFATKRPPPANPIATSLNERLQVALHAYELPGDARPLQELLVRVDLAPRDDAALVEALQQSKAIGLDNSFLVNPTWEKDNPGLILSAAARAVVEAPQPPLAAAPIPPPSPPPHAAAVATATPPPPVVPALAPPPPPPSVDANGHDAAWHAAHDAATQRAVEVSDLLALATLEGLPTNFTPSDEFKKAARRRHLHLVRYNKYEFPKLNDPNATVDELNGLFRKKFRLDKFLEQRAAEIARLEALEATAPDAKAAPDSDDAEKKRWEKARADAVIRMNEQSIVAPLADELKAETDELLAKQFGDGLTSIEFDTERYRLTSALFYYEFGVRQLNDDPDITADELDQLFREVIDLDAYVQARDIELQRFGLKDKSQKTKKSDTFLKLTVDDSDEEEEEEEEDNPELDAEVDHVFAMLMLKDKERALQLYADMAAIASLARE